MKTLLLLALFSGSQDGNYIPRTVGKTLNYISGGQDVVQKIVEVKRNTVQIKTIRGARGTQSVWFRETPAGVQMVKMNVDGKIIRLQKPVWVIKANAKVGDTWKAEVPYGKGLFVSYTYTRARNGSFTLNGRRRSTYRVTFVGNVSGTTFKGTSDYVRGAGLARQKVGRHSLELKSIK